MNITSSLAAPTRRLLAGLIVTTTATASAGAWALTAAATGPADEPTTTATVEDVTVDRPAAAASDLVPAATRPIVFPGPYPWPWITVGAATRPIVVADAYNGVGVHGLPKRHRPDRRCRRLPRRRCHRVPVNPPGVQIAVAARQGVFPPWNGSWTASPRPTFGSAAPSLYGTARPNASTE